MKADWPADVPAGGYGVTPWAKCPHSKRDDARADRCSQCLGVPVRRVEQLGSDLFVGGVRRPINAENQSAQVFYGKRGGKALRGSKAKR